MNIKYVFSTVLIAGLGIGITGCVDRGIFQREGEAFQEQVGVLNNQEIKSSREIALSGKGTTTTEDKVKKKKTEKKKEVTKEETKKEDVKVKVEDKTKEDVSETTQMIDKQTYKSLKTEDLGPLKAAPSSNIPGPDYGDGEHQKNLMEREQQQAQEIFQSRAGR